MKREIKFREYNSHWKKMYAPFTLINAITAGGISDRYNKHSIFMQYTGIKDKNGGVKEIQVRNSAGYYCKNLVRMFAHTELIPYFEEPTITLTDEQLLAECERRAISTKITK